MPCRPFAGGRAAGLGEAHMPKMKTNRATAKRFRKTGSGKFRRAKACLSHGMFNKTRKRRRRLRDNSLVDPTNQKSVRRLLPYA